MSNQPQSGSYFSDCRREETTVMETVKLPNIPDAEFDCLKEFLAEHHDVFSLEE